MAMIQKATVEDFNNYLFPSIYGMGSNKNEIADDLYRLTKSYSHL